MEAAAAAAAVTAAAEQQTGSEWRIVWLLRPAAFRMDQQLRGTKTKHAHTHKKKKNPNSDTESFIIIVSVSSLRLGARSVWRDGVESQCV